MSRFIAIVFALVLSFSAAADNISIVMNGVKIVDVIEGISLHSFSVDTANFPAPCPANRIVFDATLPLAGITLGLLLDSEYEETNMEYVKYQYEEDGQCHLRELAEEDPTHGWGFENLFPQDTVWVDPLGIPRLVSLGCPQPWDYSEIPLYYDFQQFGGSISDTMVNFSGDMCMSTRSEFLDEVNWTFPAKWRVCLGNQCTSYTEVTR